MEEKHDYTPGLAPNFEEPFILLSAEIPATSSIKTTNHANSYRDVCLKMGTPVRLDRTFDKDWPSAAATFGIEPMASNLLAGKPSWFFKSGQRSFEEGAKLPHFGGASLMSKKNQYGGVV